MSKKMKSINWSELTKEEKMKYEIAEELGLLDRVLEEGWKSLSSKETGRIGGMVTKKKREINRQGLKNLQIFGRICGWGIDRSYRWKRRYRY